MHPKRVAIVVGGAGARGGYEAGALSVLVPRLRAAGCEPRVYVGVGVGAITATPLAASADLPPAEQANAVLELWRGVSVSEVYRPPLLTLPGAAVRLIGQLVRLPGVRPTRQLDTAPPRRAVQRAIDQQRLQDNIGDKGFALAVVTTSSTDGRTVVFVDRSADATFRRGTPGTGIRTYSPVFEQRGQRQWVGARPSESRSSSWLSSRRRPECPPGPVRGGSLAVKLTTSGRCVPSAGVTAGRYAVNSPRSGGLDRMTAERSLTEAFAQGGQAV
jgi:Patatin-like phospholipase